MFALRVLLLYQEIFQNVTWYIRLSCISVKGLIPRDILYAPDDSINQSQGDSVNGAPVTDSESQNNHEPEDEIIENPSDIQDSYASGTDNMPDEVTEEAETAVRAYYFRTVFQVVEMVCIEQSETEVIFSVKVSRGGVVQEPNRTITL